MYSTPSRLQAYKELEIIMDFDAWANKLIVFSLHDVALFVGEGAGADWSG
jgi:hypothetical protein